MKNLNLEMIENQVLDKNDQNQKKMINGQAPLDTNM